MTLILMGLFYVALKVYQWRKIIELKRVEHALPSLVKDQLNELQKYRQKYGKALVLLILLGSLFAAHLLLSHYLKLSRGIRGVCLCCPD